jgi:hypothetical protein
MVLLFPVAAAIGGVGLWRRSAGQAEDRALEARLSIPLAAPTGPQAVFHLGHSLVNRDMPAMLAQLAGEGHRYESQLGWGTTLKAHWGDDTISGFEAENAHPRFRPGLEAVRSGDYDAIVLTEMVEIKASLRYHDSPDYLALWAKEAIAARPDVRLYLYETWHQLDDKEGWLERLDADLDRYWVDGILKPALADLPPDTRIHVIPAGQALAAFARAVKARGGVGDVRDQTDLFLRNPDGSQDQIHLNDLGNYLVAMVHFVVLYHRSPVGLPHQLSRADGHPATAPLPETARLMQETVLDVVRKTPMTGVVI